MNPSDAGGAFLRGFFLDILWRNQIFGELPRVQEVGNSETINFDGRKLECQIPKQDVSEHQQT
jgi:hypothetical protein